MQLLVVDVNRRLGSGPADAEAIKSHLFFRSTNWDRVLKRQVEPPFRPTLSSDTDVSLFDPKFTQENPVESPDEGLPISDGVNDVFQGFTYVDPSVHIDMARDPWASQRPCCRSRRRSGIYASGSPGFVGHTLMASTTGLIPGGSSHGIPHAGTPHPEQLPPTTIPRPPSAHSQQEPFVFAEDFEDMDVSSTGVSCPGESCENAISQTANTTLASNMDVLASAALNGSTALRHPGSACDRSTLQLNGAVPIGQTSPMQQPILTRGTPVQGFSLTTNLATSTRLPIATHQSTQPTFNLASPLTRPSGTMHPYLYGTNALLFQSMSKRSHAEALGQDACNEETPHSDAQPSASFCKRLLSSSSEPISFTRVRSLEEMDKRTLQLQNKKLWELDEDGQILLQRFDSDIEEEIPISTESFLKQLSSWDKEEVPEKLQERVHFSKRVIARLLSAYERLVARQCRLRRLCASARDASSSNSAPASSMRLTPAGQSPQPSCSRSSETDTTDADRDPRDNHLTDSDQVTTLCEELAQVNKENQRLQSLCTNLHAKHRQSSLKASARICDLDTVGSRNVIRELQDLAQTRSDAAAEWQAKYEDLDYKLSQALSQVTRLDHRLCDVQQLNKQLEVELAAFKGTDISNSDDLQSVALGGTVNRNKYNDLVCELEELRELVTSRSSELERIQVKLAEKVGENEALSMQLHTHPRIPAMSIVSSVDHQAGEPIHCARTNSWNSNLLSFHLYHSVTSLLPFSLVFISNEAAIQNQMRSEMLHIESQYSQLRRTHETMELDFKQALAHNEQAGPINSEMRSLISTLQTQNKQLKAEVARYRRKCKEVNQDLELVKTDLKATEEEMTQVRAALAEATAAVIAAGARTETPPSVADLESEIKRDSSGVLSPRSAETTIPSRYSTNSIGLTTCPSCHASGSVESTIEIKCPIKTEPVVDNSPSIQTGHAGSDEVIRELKEQLKRSQESQKEMSVLLNMYKVIPKDQRDKAALLQCEAKLRSEVADLKCDLEKLQANHTETQQQNARLTQQLQLLQQQLQQRGARESPFPKASPVERTPPIQSAAFAPDRTNLGLVTASPSAISQKAALFSPDDQKSVSGRTPPQANSVINPVTIPGLRLELQITRRRRQSLEGHLELYQHRLLVAQQQEEVLLKEMEVTGQAFEDVQEQNVRLVRTLREKDDANLKLMTERLKTAQLARLLKEDKHLLEEQIRLMQAKIEALNRAVLKQEDKERLLLTNLDTLEKESSARQQAQEAYKRKAIESQQVAEDLRVTVQKYQSQLKEAQISVQEKASTFERISFRNQRLQEELISIRRKYERLKKIEQSHNADEVLLAEIQDYKEQLTCPTCKTNRKDAILTKCFHVFCLNCLKTRYETRNRKCPKCNATFGANDYHRIYLS
ncbi:hypothetical protein P879_05189 [Paragonimus westermani]|uniref:RING-type E3 ubiquitin transferase n=1 Tax=Paragonimus westermani TaxID=34504 RepID=A0A8T0DNX8_9TREM|nr:hypothetical protein P879_05189 [Paragonimus westermani]